MQHRRRLLGRKIVVKVKVACIRLLVSDVDGTLVQPDKSLTPSTIAAAARVQAAGVLLAIVSARPPRGMKWIADQLHLTAPLAGFQRLTAAPARSWPATW